MLERVKGALINSKDVMLLKLLKRLYLGFLYEGNGKRLYFPINILVKRHYGFMELRKKKTPRKVTKQEYIPNTFSSLNMILKHQSCHPPAVAKVKCSPQMPEHSFYLINFLTGETSQLLKKKIIDLYRKRKRMI